jgi:AraC-like DNA-binding protein
VGAVAYLSEAHFIRSFRAAFGETPHRYLQRRRVERSMFLLRETDRSVTDICFDVGFTSRELGRALERLHFQPGLPQCDSCREAGDASACNQRFLPTNCAVRLAGGEVAP